VDASRPKIIQNATIEKLYYYKRAFIIECLQAVEHIRDEIVNLSDEFVNL